MSSVKSTKVKILVADDERSIRNGLKEALEKVGYRVDTARNGDLAAQMLEDSLYNLLICDLKMPGKTGLELLDFAREKSPDTTSVIITAYGTIPTAVDAMRKGAYDYIVKPLDIKQMRLLVQKALEYQFLVAENKELRARLQSMISFETIVGNSEKMREVYEQAIQVAASGATVLLQGPSGTGKELIARAIHARSRRAEKPFVTMNCGAIPETLFESELFGHAKGSFTGAYYDSVGRFEQADGGTLFLDEVGEMSLKSQVTFLRVLEQKEFRKVGGRQVLKADVRIISATNTDLEQAVQDGRFRADLFYRLNVIPITLPRLEERKEDIPLLVHVFLTRYCRIHQRPSKTVSDEAVRMLTNYFWPGNVRQLQNTIERLVVVTREKEILPHHLPDFLQTTDTSLGHITVELGATIEQVEKKLIEQTLARVTSNRKKAAELLGISLRTLQYKLKEYGLLGAE